MLIMRERRAFPRGPDRHEAVGALADLPLDQVAEHLLVDRAVFERRDQRGKRSPEVRLGGHGTLPALKHRARTRGFARNYRFGGPGERPNACVSRHSRLFVRMPSSAEIAPLSPWFATIVGTRGGSVSNSSTGFVGQQ